MQYAALVSQLTSKARAVLKELPLPGSTVDSAAVRRARAARAAPLSAA